jgi:putative ABC transport system substrate-binding protein
VLRNTVLALILALGICLSPLTADAQQAAKVPRIGFLRTFPAPEMEKAFRQGLQELGYVEGQNLLIEQRYWNGNADRLAEVVAELLRLKVDVIVAPTTTEIEAARKGTTTTPIVMVAGSDPVALGFITSLARPGGNITGLTNLSAEVTPKRLQLLKDAIPRLARVAALYNPVDRAATAEQRDLESAARSLGMKLWPLEVRGPGDLDGAFAAAVKGQAGALLVLSGPTASAYRVRLVELAAKYRLPASFHERLFVEAGGLMSYGPDIPDLFRRSATYVDKLLKGAKPAELPVEQPTKFDLAINLKTARALGSVAPWRGGHDITLHATA